MTRILNMLITGALAATLGLAAEAIDTRPSWNDKQLAQMAKAAKTAQEHLEVARQYELRAATLETKAKQYEEQVDALSQRKADVPMTYKWPSLAQASTDRARSKALQARRAAKESLDLVAFHKAQAAKLAAQAD